VHVSCLVAPPIQDQKNPPSPLWRIGPCLACKTPQKQQEFQWLKLMACHQKMLLISLSVAAPITTPHLLHFIISHSIFCPRRRA
jgi:hypothetical protein